MNLVVLKKLLAYVVIYGFLLICGYNLVIIFIRTNYWPDPYEIIQNVTILELKYNISCKQIIEGDENEIKKALSISKSSKKFKSDLAALSSYCQYYLEKRPYVLKLLSIILDKMKQKTTLVSSYQSVDNLPLIKINGNISCKKIIEGDQIEIQKAQNIRKISKKDMNFRKLGPDLEELSSYCDVYLKNRPYVLKPINQEEEDFPIAYSIIMYKEAFRVERLLRAIYRPQNVYCIHVDAKASSLTYKIMQNIARCFHNVFIASQRINVKWGRFSVAKADLVCLEDLFKSPVKWKYFVNLCGQEFPIKTNLELVRVLKAYKGASDVSEATYKRIPQVLTRVKYGYYKNGTKYRKPPFAYNVTWAKGSVHAALKREFASFFINSEIGREFVKYISDTKFSDEHLWSPIFFSPQLGVPGSYTGNHWLRMNPINGESMVRYKLWNFGKRPRNTIFTCHGKFAHSICILGVGDLYPMVNSHKLFANKFHADYQPIAYDCLEQYIWNNTRLDVMGENRLNTSIYSSLDIVHNHL